MHPLHTLEAGGQIKGFVLSYLGQSDSTLPCPPPDLVRREEVFGYPTDFAAMTGDNIEKLSKRGEQLTRLLLNHNCPRL